MSGKLVSLAPPASPAARPGMPSAASHGARPSNVVNSLTILWNARMSR
jgi:hypothetical protein